MVRTLLLALACLLAPLCVPVQAMSAAAAAKGMRSDAFKYLQRNQNDDGSYGGAEADPVAVTGLVVYVLADSDRAYREIDGPFMSRAVDWLVATQQADGSFGDGGEPDVIQVRTDLAASALRALDNPAYTEAIAKARVFLGRPPRFTLPATGWAKARSLGLDVDQLARVLKAGDESAYPAGDLARSIMVTLHGNRQAKDDRDPAYGSILSPAGTGFESDPVVSTALGGWLADRMAVHGKRLGL